METTDTKARPEEELFIEKYFGLSSEVHGRHPIWTDYGHLVNILTMFKNSCLSAQKAELEKSITQEKAKAFDEGCEAQKAVCAGQILWGQQMIDIERNVRHCKNSVNPYRQDK